MGHLGQAIEETAIMTILQSTYRTAQWGQRGPSVYLDGRALLDGVDAVAVEMERKWGVDRLRLLVDADLRAKFDRQQAKLNAAIWSGDLDDLQRECPRMITAWRVLDAKATEAGAAPLSPAVWETALSDGTLLAIVRDNADAHAVLADGRLTQVWTLDEVARCIEAFPAVVKAKAAFPGATVKQPTKPPASPLRDLVDDEIPF